MVAVLALTFQRPYLSDQHLAEPLARLAGDHERRVGEHDGITVSGCAIRPGTEAIVVSLGRSSLSLIRNHDSWCVREHDGRVVLVIA